MYISTRNSLHFQTLSAAIKEGLASDGGLFVPQQMPKVDLSSFSTEMSYAEFASKVLQPYFRQDPLAKSLPDFCNKAFHFPLPLKPLDSNTLVLELFHGPTSSFKDFGACFLAECLDASKEGQKTIIVATSGDTGSAVASAFYRKEKCRVIILYPDGQISARQEQQITCWGENIFAFAVKSNFDQCQFLVKSAAKDLHWPGLSFANSINIARLLPQLTYYAYSALSFFRQHHVKPGFIIPSGNLGNATAAFWAKAMGFPIREIVLACNANRSVVDYLQNQSYQPQASIKTLANAMDVGNPSNMERLQHLFPSVTDFKQNVQAFSVNNREIIQASRYVYEQYGYISCPHTATAFHIRKQLSKEQPWIVVATADPCKFDEVIEPIIKVKVPLAPQLQKLLERPQKIRRIKASLDELKNLT